jgi:hypothetical protein
MGIGSSIEFFFTFFANLIAAKFRLCVVGFTSFFSHNYLCRHVCQRFNFKKQLTSRMLKEKALG